MPIIDFVFTKNKKLVDRVVILAFDRFVKGWDERQKKINKQVFKDWVKEFNVSSKKLVEYPYFKAIIPVASPDERKLYALYLKERKTKKDKEEFESLSRKIKAVDKMVAELDDCGSIKTKMFGGWVYAKIPIYEAIFGKDKDLKKYLQIDKINKFMEYKAKEVANSYNLDEGSIYSELVKHLDKQCVKHDPTKGATFRTWSNKVIRNKLASIIKRDKRPFTKSLDLDSESNKKDYIPEKKYTPITRNTTMIWRIKVRFDLDQLYKKLTKPQKKVFDKLKKDKSQEQTAKELGISQSAVRDSLILIRKKADTT